MSWLWPSKEPPKPSKPPVGEGFQPALVKKGTLEHYLLSCIMDKIQEDPDDDDLGGILTYTQELDAIAESGRGVDTIYVSRCIKMATKAAESEAQLSAASRSRTSRSDSGSSASHVSSHGSDTSSSINIDPSRDYTKFELTTRPTTADPSPRSRPVLVKHRRGKRSFILRRVAAESGISELPGESVLVHLTLGEQMLQCWLVISDDLEIDLVLAAHVAVKFVNYKPNDRMLDYIRNSTTMDYTSPGPRSTTTTGTGGRRADDDNDEEEIYKTILWAGGKYKNSQIQKT